MGFEPFPVIQHEERRDWRLEYLETTLGIRRNAPEKSHVVPKCHFCTN